MGTNIEFAKSLYISVNGTNKVSLPYLLLPYVILAHYGAVKGDLEGIFISEFPHQEILKSEMKIPSKSHFNGPIMCKDDTREQQIR